MFFGYSNFRFKKLVTELSKMLDILALESTYPVPFQPARTITKVISFSGIGVHSGRQVHVTLRPAAYAGQGIIFSRTDVAADKAQIPARWDYVTDTTMSTTIANEHGTSVATIEHLMAALSALHIDDITVTLDGPEMPIMDGSSAHFITLLQEAGLIDSPTPRQFAVLMRPIEVRDGDRYIRLIPARQPTYRVTFTGHGFDLPTQSFEYIPSSAGFARFIAAARTFGRMADAETLRAHGLAQGASLDNTLVLDGGAVVNPEGVRYNDECVRHKILDAIGDMALSGLPILCTYEAVDPGHRLNNLILREVFKPENKDALRLVHAAPLN